MMTELWAITCAWFGAGALTCKNGDASWDVSGTRTVLVLRKGDSGSSLYCSSSPWAMRG